MSAPTLPDETAFDALATMYDDVFTQSVIGRWLRGDVYRLLDELWHVGDRVLELGCGTGEDAQWMIRRGIEVFPTDASLQMRAVAQAKLGDVVQVRALNLNALPNAWHDNTYSGVLANFGVMNCAQDLGAVAEWIDRHTVDGSTIVLVIMARYCIWEMLWHGLHGDINTATRRWRNSTFVSDSNHEGIPLIYPTIRQIQRAFAPMFRLQQTMPLGFTLPPSDVYGVLEKRPRWLKQLRQWELWAQKRRFLSNFADHCVMVLSK